MVHVVGKDIARAGRRIELAIPGAETGVVLFTPDGQEKVSNMPPASLSAAFTTIKKA
jgi:hypothetical protein